MALPQRVYDEDDEQPITRPNLRLIKEGDDEENPSSDTDVQDNYDGLRSIQGGGQRTARKKGHLGLVDNARRGEGGQPYDGESQGSQSEGFSSDELKEKEESPDSEQEQDESSEEQDALSSKGIYTGSGAKNKQSNSNKKALFIGGGFIGVFVAVIGGMMMFLQPFLLTHVVENIENRVGQVPSYAVERRMDYYINRYLIIRTLAGDVDINDGRFTFLGKGFIDTLYTNWKGAKLENEFVESGFRLETREGGLTKNGMRANKFTLVNDGVSTNSPLHRRDLNAKESRQLIKEFATSRTNRKNVFKRHHTRKVMKKFYGVPNWKPFERTRESYQEKKTKFKKEMVNRTVGRLSERYGKYMNCLLEGEEKCKEIRKGSENTNRGSPEVDFDGDGNIDNPGSPSNLDGAEIKTAANAAVDEIGDVVDKKFATELLDTLQRVGVRKLLASAVAGLGVIDVVSKVVQSLDDGSINTIIYDKNTQQYAGFASPILSAADQIRSGEDFDYTDLQVMVEMFKGFQESPVYQAGAGKLDPNKNVVRDCNDDGDTNDPEDVLEKGEVVCPGKKALVDKTAFTNHPGWQAIATISDYYEGSVGRLFDAVSGVGTWLAEKSGLSGAIQSLMDTFGISGAIAEGFKTIMGWIAGPVVSGAEEGAAAYDATYAGISTLSASTGGGVGTRSDDDGTIGGGILNDGQVLAIETEMQEQRDYELRNTSVFARYFSPSVPESLTSYAIVNNPGSLMTLGNKIGSLFSIKSVGSIFSSFTSKKVQAADRNNNPFDVLQFGFPADHPIFTANNGDGMDPDEVTRIYKCDLPADQRPQNQDTTYDKPTMDNGNELPFKVATQADPCMLEKAVIEAGSMAFTGGYDEGIDASSDTTNNGSGGGLGISPDGFVFPIKTTKSVIEAGTSQNGTTLKWCKTSLTNCHHDYNAADIFVPEGTPVVAAKDGTVIFAHDRDPGQGSSLAILVDGFVFWYGHLQSGSITSRGIVSGKVVKAGDELGAVGNNSDADNTAGHLHFDAQPAPPATTREACASAACTLAPFVFTDVQPALVPSYNALPD